MMQSRCTRSSPLALHEEGNYKRPLRQRKARPCSARLPAGSRAWWMGFKICSNSNGIAAATEAGGRLHDPCSGVGILPAVLANAWKISLDVAGIARIAVKRRMNRQNEPGFPLDEVMIDGFHCLPGVRRIAGARKHGPGSARSSRWSTRRREPNPEVCHRRRRRDDTTLRPRRVSSTDARSATACAAKSV